MVINLDAKYYHSCGIKDGEVIYSDKLYTEEIPHHKFQKEFYKQYPGGSMFDMFHYWEHYLLGNGYATEEELASKGGYYAK